MMILQGVQHFLPRARPRLGPPGDAGHGRPDDPPARGQRLQRPGPEGREGGVREQRLPADHEGLHRQPGGRFIQHSHGSLAFYKDLSVPGSQLSLCHKEPAKQGASP